MEKIRHYALWLTGIMAAVFVLQLLFPELTLNLVLVSSDAISRPWILLTAIFLHANVAHILFNGFGLVVFGSVLEQIIGSKRFLAVFFATGLLSSIASAFFYNSVLGASGAVFGVLGALTVLRPTMTVWVYYIPMPMYLAAIMWAAADLFGFFFPSGIANAGHLAGLAAGIVAGLIIRGNLPRFEREKAQKNGMMTVDEFEKWERENLGRQ